MSVVAGARERHVADARLGKGIPRVAKAATAISRKINLKRKARGLNPRCVSQSLPPIRGVGKVTAGTTGLWFSQAFLATLES